MRYLSESLFFPSLVAGILMGCLFHGIALADPAIPDPMPAQTNSEITYEVGLSAWLSEGRTKWDHDASGIDPLLGNPTSELTYKDVVSHVLEFQGKVQHRDSIIIKGVFGYGMIGDGTLLDDDYLSAAGAAATGATISGPHRWLRTESDITDGDLWYVNVDIGMPIVSFYDGALLFDGFIGYQHWREKYVAQGVRTLECTIAACSPPGTITNTGQDVITNTVEWDSLRVGLNGEVTLWDRIVVYSHGVYVPYTSLVNEDNHHLRTGLRHDPSFTMTGTGYGYNIEGGVRLRIFQGFSLTAGYRYWELMVKDGQWRNHPIAGFPDKLNLNKFTTSRHGATFGVLYTF